MITTEELRSPVLALLSDEEVAPDDEEFITPTPGEEDGVGENPESDGAGFGLDDGIETPGQAPGEEGY